MGKQNRRADRTHGGKDESRPPRAQLARLYGTLKDRKAQNEQARRPGEPTRQERKN